MSAWMSEKPTTKSGSQLQDLVDLRAGERGHLRFFLARARRPHGEAGDADDALLLAERVQHFGGLFGEADDALGAAMRGIGIETQRAASPRRRFPIRDSPIPRRHGYSIRAANRSLAPYAGARAGGTPRRTRTRCGPAPRRIRPSAAVAVPARRRSAARFRRCAPRTSRGPASGCDCSEAQAPIWLPRARVGEIRVGFRRGQPFDATLDAHLHAFAHASSSGSTAPPADARRAARPWRCRSWCRNGSRARPRPSAARCARTPGRRIGTSPASSRSVRDRRPRVASSSSPRNVASAC